MGLSWVSLDLHAITFQSQCLPNTLLSLSHLSPGLVQRCVIIQKDQHGFGFTVSGDRIVLVQSVRPGKCCTPPSVDSSQKTTLYVTVLHDLQNLHVISL